jgi:NRAMP (natural resistance-associated macrophage protein)-like metal ion transporter
MGLLLQCLAIRLGSFFSFLKSFSKRYRVELTCAKLSCNYHNHATGVTTGLHLAQVARQEFHPFVRTLLWLMTEIAIIGSDIQEVVGSAIAFHVLFGWPLWLGVIVTFLDTFTFLLLERYGIGKLEALFAVLVGTMSVSFGYVFFAGNPEWQKIGFGVFVPTVSKSTLSVAVGMVGAVIMPHNLYLHSALVLSRSVDRENKKAVQQAMAYNAIESAMALFISFTINLCVVCVFAASFYSSDKESVCLIDDGSGTAYSVKCNDIGLADAAGALHAHLGGAAKIVWGIGLLASGQSSTMTGTYTGQFVTNGFLDLKLSKWQRILYTRAISIIPAVLVAILAGGHLDELDQGLNILQSIQLPFAIIPLLLFTSSETIMGVHRNSKRLTYAARCIAFIVISVNVVLMVFFVEEMWGFTAVSIPLMILAFLVYFAAMFTLANATLHGVTAEAMVDIEVDEEPPVNSEMETMSVTRSAHAMVGGITPISRSDGNLESDSERAPIIGVVDATAV